MNRNRLEAFSDGVLAIIITIMVLELKVPHEASFNVLLPLLPVFFSYLMSFAFVAIYWMNHHHLLHTVKVVTSDVLWSNMSLLFSLSLIPFTTAWMGENHFATEALILYCINLFICAVTFYLLQLSIMRHHTHTTALIEALNKQKSKGIISLGLYLLSIGASFFSSWLAAAIIVGTAIMWMIPNKQIEKALKEER